MLDRVADVLAPLNTLPDFDLFSEDAGAGPLDSTLRGLAESRPAADEDTAAAIDAGVSPIIARSAAADVSDVLGDSVSGPGPQQRPGRQAASSASSDDRPSGAITFLRQEVRRHFNSPLMRLAARHQQSPTRNTPLDRFAQAMTADTSRPAGGAEPDAIGFRRGPLGTAGTIAREGTATDSGTADDAAADGARMKRGARSATVPRPRFLGESNGASSGRGARASHKSEQEMKAALERIERDVAELKRKPATWGGGR